MARSQAFAAASTDETMPGTEKAVSSVPALAEAEPSSFPPDGAQRVPFPAPAEAGRKPA